MPHIAMTHRACDHDETMKNLRCKWKLRFSAGPLSKNPTPSPKKTKVASFFPPADLAE
jgi:hypothetical protein